MDVFKLYEDIKAQTTENVLMHDMVLPISAENMYAIMSNPLNWSIINFPIIKRVDILDANEKYVRFVLHERILGKYIQSEILLETDTQNKLIHYHHIDPHFPFVLTMSSTWIFKNYDINHSHFYIIRKFRPKNKVIKFLLKIGLLSLINRHVRHYYNQLIEVTKSIQIIYNKI